MKHVVITGSTRGIGLCMAREFLKAGCCVTVSGRSDASFGAAREEFSAYGDRVLYVPCDVRRFGELERLWDESAARWGRIDIWINNAGKSAPYAFVHETAPDAADAVIETNLKGVIYGSRVAAKHMLVQGGGSIWNMEGLGSNGMIQLRTVLYGTTKCAITYFTKGLAKELEGTPVTAGRLSPGMMLPDFITKTPDGEPSPVLRTERFRKVFNTLGDRPETVAAFFVPRMLSNTKNGAQLVWLTGRKALARFAVAMFRNRNLV